MFNNPLFQQFQQKMADAQAAIDQMTATGEAGGGLVRAVASGSLRIKEIHIAPEARADNDPGMLEDLVLTAVNRAVDAAREMAAREMASVTKGMLPPGMGF